uniref:C3H1-type domain-containing protein n=1 Tax=Globisporangium ultimum (strain ATCC 200006 / CBS 805.95 / DAOM BR144) TaxID=431595 RepID=K3X8Q0_GLOUD
MQAAESSKASRSFERQCVFFAQGTCRNGANCHFAHGDPRASAAGASSHTNGHATASSNGQRTATTNGSATAAGIISATQAPSAADISTSSSSSAAPVVDGTKDIEREVIRGVATTGEESGGGRTHAAWGEAFLEGVTKCEGTSGRKLYLYGISSTRCPMCRHRVKIESDVCDNCEYRHQRARSCKMCTLRKPSMWCYECDSYFCETCHQKPHVLVLGGSAPVAHHCYAIEGASGKLHEKSAWSMDFLATVKSVYRLRISERMSQEASTTHQAHDARHSNANAHNTSAQPLTPTTSSSPSRDAAQSTARRAEQQAVPRSLVTADASQSSPAAQEESQALRTQRDGVTLGSGTGSSTTTQTQQTTGVPAATATIVVSTTATTVAAERSGRSATTSATPAVPEPSSPSRKRKLSSDTEPGRAIPPPPAATAAAASLPLYERVRLMHEQTAKQKHMKFQNQQEILFRQRQHQQQEQQKLEEQQRSQQQRLQEMQTFREQLQAKHQQAKAVQENLQRQQQLFLLHQRRQELQRRQQQQLQQQQPGQQTISQLVPRSIAPVTSPVSSAGLTVVTSSQTVATNTAAAAVVAQAPSPLLQPATSVPLAPPHYLQAQQQTLSHQPSPTHQPDVGGFAPQAPVPVVAPAAASSAVVDLSSAREVATSAPMQNISFADGPSSMDDPLKFAVVSEYDEVNSRAIKMEARTAELNAKVRQVSMQSVTLAAKFNEQIKVYRTTLEQVYEQRYVALAKVIMFSPDVRARVRMIEQSTLGDIPHVLTACHKKCAQLATEIKSYEKNVQNLRNAIDAAISSGDPEKLGQLHLLGKQISSHEQKIQSLKADRDSQFVYMIQFSRKLREVVRQHAVQNSKSKSS